MDFRTAIKPAPATIRVDHSSGIMMLGSCFSDNIGRRLLDGLFDVDVNPMGTLYNPASIASALDDIMERREFAAADLFEHDGRWHSFAHHSRFSGTDPEKVLKGINSRLRTAHDNLRLGRVLIVTLGTAWIFSLRATGRVVSNCHKLPQAMFERSRMSVSDIVTLWQPLLSRLREFNPSLQVIFTVSPIRHLADGAHGNQLSKATLLLAVDALIEAASTVMPTEAVCPDGTILLIDPVPPMAMEYFPAYEALMDDLRDYRFYANILYDGAIWRGHEMDIHYTTVDGEEVAGEDLTPYGTSTVASVSRTGYYMAKFLNERQTIDNDDTYASSQNCILWRYAELLLDYAEIDFRLGRPGEALKKVNRIRERVHMPALTSVTWEDIMNERRVELAFEKTIYWDLLRYNIAEEKMTGTTNPLFGVKIVYRANGTKRITNPVVNGRNTVVRYFRARQYFLPIAWDDIRYHGIEQNPEWVEM